MSSHILHGIIARVATRAAERQFSTSRTRRADFTHAVIGAGVVGLAIARQLAGRDGTSTILIERHGSAGTETSSRNSEVIHAGLYYGHGTLKTRLCVRGKEMMYDLCGRRGIPHRRTKKWIIAQDEHQMDELGKVHEFASSLGVPTKFLSREDITTREPDVRAEAGVLESESTGILDVHSLLSYLEGDFQSQGGDCAFHTAVTGIAPIAGGKGGYTIYYAGKAKEGGRGGEDEKEEEEQEQEQGPDDSIQVETVVNSAGLSACAINNMVLPKERHRKPYYAKGNYYSYAATHPKPQTLLYPAPVPGFGGLGTHLTLDMAGRVRFGPDVEWVEDPNDLRPNPSRLQEAIDMIHTYLPTVRRDAVDLDYCGIRPKLARSGATAGSKNFQDFIIREEHGFPGFINLLAIESPGLTCSLAIGEMVEELLYG